MGARLEKSKARLKMISPQLVVPDVVEAAEYYRDVLGFQILGYFYQPPVYYPAPYYSAPPSYSYPPPPPAAAPSRGSSYGSEDCRRYETRITIDGKPQTLSGTVCKGADGNWHTVQ